MMKKSLHILCISIILPLLFSSDLLAAQRGIKVTINTPTGESIPLYNDSYALVVGNGNYSQGWDPLPGAIRDVKEISEALRKNGFKVTLKMDLNRDSFTKAFADFVHIHGKDINNRLLFYYAGHGHTQKMATEEEIGYLVMVDTPDPETDPVGFSIRSMDMQSLVTQAKMIMAKHVLFIFDSCFSGTVLNLRDRITPDLISENVKYPVRQFITAGRANESVPDYSVFKQCFLDILEGREDELVKDGYLTGEELGLFLKNKVPTYNENQHPQYGKIKDPKLDKGDFVFTLPKPMVIKKSPSTDLEAERQQLKEEQAKVEHERLELEKLKLETERQQLEEKQIKIEHERLELEKLKLETERQQLEEKQIKIEHEKQELEKLQLETEKKQLEEERKLLETEKVKIQTSSLQSYPEQSHAKSKSKEIKRDDSFITYSNGIVKDLLTGLEWVAGPDRTMNRRDASVWLKGLSLAGGGWRFPTMEELEDLYKNGKGPHNISPELEMKGWRIWSGEKLGSGKNSVVKIFDFQRGKQTIIKWYIAQGNRAFAVRSRDDE